MCAVVWARARVCCGVCVHKRVHVWEDCTYLFLSELFFLYLLYVLGDDGSPPVPQSWGWVVMRGAVCANCAAGFGRIDVPCPRPPQVTPHTIATQTEEPVPRQAATSVQVPPLPSCVSCLPPRTHA